MQPARVSTCKQLCHFCDCMCFKRIEQIFLMACHRRVYSKRGTDNLWKGSLKERDRRRIQRKNTKGKREGDRDRKSEIERCEKKNQ